MMTTKTILLPNGNTQNQTWDTLYGCSLPLLLSEYCENNTGIKLIITPDNLSANQLHDEMQFFLGGNSRQEIMLFPDWETLPYDQFSPHQDIISERLQVLSRIQQSSNIIVIIATSTLMHRLCPPVFLMKYGLSIQQGQSVDLHGFRQQLQEAGYRAVNKVLEHGEYAVRGSIIDLYPMGSDYPFRIELFDDEVDSLRRFDPENQLTIDKLNQIHILPAHEFPMDETSIAHFRRGFRETFPGNPSRCPIYEIITEGQCPSGIEYYLPLFYETTATFFDFLPANTLVCLAGAIPPATEQFWQELNKRYEQRSYDITRPILPPERCFISPTDIHTLINHYRPLRISQTPSDKKTHVYSFDIAPPPELPISRSAPEPLNALSQYLAKTSHRCLLVVESAGRREVLIDLLKRHQIHPHVLPSWQAFLDDTVMIGMTIGDLSTGAEILDSGITIIVESQLFGQSRVPQRRSTQKSIDPDLLIRSLSEIQVDTPVVHVNFGVGRYQGMECIESHGILSEFLVLAYAGGDKIYVPVTSLNFISRYTGSDPDNAPLHRLGTDQWQKEKKKAAEKIHDVAIELLEIYAKREIQKGFACQFDSNEYQLFASAFPFDETVDQQTAIVQIIKDMTSAKPMDRLICGDVGFGKTEVAMRAAFIATQNNKQVCILVPTTLLAGQHYETFRDRFADFPVRVELLSRFRNAKESEQVMEGLEQGHVDIVIGTHKLLQKHMGFKSLGLLIIDEEHRFGVKQKEHMKALKHHVDVLSMTATPIPRTLNMAMSGIRDISLIATPPAKRLAIKTFWQERQNSVIREAILREILRGGQVFFLHNHVQSINHICQELQILVPEAKISLAHGQMRERELERVMSDFYHHRFNVLVCTTIIETGIDIPTANTIIMDSADEFGLAQLHQLRGRVGRSHHQAYAYLLTKDKKLLTKDAIKRLDAIVSLEDLGAGFTLATHDLEIRGAGELLGEDQSGNMHAIGFNLFMEMLDRAVHDLKSGKIPELNTPMNLGPEINLGLSAIIPEDYINDVHTRLIMYKQIANARNREQLHQLQIELIDRFGLLPVPVKHLLLITELKWLAASMGVKRVSASRNEGKIEFGDAATINAETLIHLIQVHAKKYKLDGPSQLRFTLEGESSEARIHEIDALLTKLRSKS
jgi:transcription-repair coupling factor (superfamily II helicase)